jgi:hypothetical protein
MDGKFDGSINADKINSFVLGPKVRRNMELIAKIGEKV